jgi:uncharacterized protein (DUF1697 family)
MTEGRIEGRIEGRTERRTERRVALLRGINVGGHRKVPMAELRTVLTDRVGLIDVATYIQSGNVVFSGGSSNAGDVTSSISAAIVDHFGFDVPVVVRDADSLATLLARSAELYPVVDDVSHDKRVMVGFLTARPTAASVAAIDADRSPGDSIVVESDHAHIHYATGQSSTKLTGDYLERVLGVGMTTRNLATIRKLVGLV